MMVRLYYQERSQNCRKVHLALLEVGADYELVHVDPSPRGATKRASVLAMNPNAEVPTLVDGDFVLWEANAILWYLAEKYPMTRLVPEDRLERARLQQLLFWQSTVLGPSMDRAEQDLDARRAEAVRALEILGMLLGGRPTALGDGPSIADLSLGASAELASELGLELPAAAAAWLRTMRRRPSWAKVFGERAR